MSKERGGQDEVVEKGIRDKGEREREKAREREIGRTLKEYKCSRGMGERKAGSRRAKRSWGGKKRAKKEEKTKSKNYFYFERIFLVCFHISLSLSLTLERSLA